MIQVSLSHLLKFHIGPWLALQCVVMSKSCLYLHVFNSFSAFCVKLWMYTNLHTEGNISGISVRKFWDKINKPEHQNIMVHRWERDIFPQNTMFISVLWLHEQIFPSQCKWNKQTHRDNKKHCDKHWLALFNWYVIPICHYALYLINLINQFSSLIRQDYSLNTRTTYKYYCFLFVWCNWDI